MSSSQRWLFGGFFGFYETHSKTSDWDGVPSYTESYARNVASKVERNALQSKVHIDDGTWMDKTWCCPILYSRKTGRTDILYSLY